MKKKATKHGNTPLSYCPMCPERVYPIERPGHAWQCPKCKFIDAQPGYDGGCKSGWSY